jgi:hypothetical protein
MVDQPCGSLWLLMMALRMLTDLTGRTARRNNF